MTKGEYSLKFLQHQNTIEQAENKNRLMYEYKKNFEKSKESNVKENKLYKSKV